VTAVVDGSGCFMRSCMEHPTPAWVGPAILFVLVVLPLIVGCIALGRMERNDDEDA
jgi:hypothetical protein